MGRVVILASGSPRRRELLEAMGVKFRVIPSDFDEYIDHSVSAKELSIALGLGKARAVAEKYPDAFVIGSDTIVTLKEKHLGKAKDEAEARAVLHDHHNETALVTTSIVVVCKSLSVEEVAADEAKVFFKPKDEAAIERYLATGDWKDKAASWGIQSGAAPLMRGIAGEYDTILGLPTKILAKMLLKHGIEAHPAKLSLPNFS